MTPETEALIARAIQCHSVMTTTADSLTYAGANRELRRLAPQLATALKAAEKRADTAEAKLKAARDILAVAYKAGKIAQIPSAHYLLEAMESVLTLEP